MKVIVLYRPNSEFSSSVETFIHDLQTQHNIDADHMQITDYDSPEGNVLATLYGVMTQPAIIVTDDYGGYVKHWEGGDMPLLADVVGYTMAYN